MGVTETNKEASEMTTTETRNPFSYERALREAGLDSEIVGLAFEALSKFVKERNELKRFYKEMAKDCLAEVEKMEQGGTHNLFGALGSRADEAVRKSAHLTATQDHLREMRYLVKTMLKTNWTIELDPFNWTGEA